MKIGYPCINRSVDCTANGTFRLKSYSEKRLVETVGKNLACLKKILCYNIEHSMLFLRISSDIIPFASHPICAVNWKKYFSQEFKALGALIKKHSIRISMHPDQFTILNAKERRIIDNSIRELRYHAAVLDSMGLDTTAKVQVHVGGVYGDKKESMRRFIEHYNKLETIISRRLVIENDDRLYSLKDCCAIHEQTGIPVLFDVFHHSILNNKETVPAALSRAAATWQKSDGIPMIDYSSQEKNERNGKHVRSIDIRDFKRFLKLSRNHDFDCMLEIKDKERSALKAVTAAVKDPRFSG
ncbi:MAG: UV DNA damage repair endonuclease UvsE [Chitinivibrionales bacterium]|nr:UV DNA damage repair endonuclease UvsE [Chitinivibrionales bacterium]